MSFSPTIPFRCSNLCAPRPTTLAPRLSFILNIHPAEFSTLFRYSVLPAIAMESQPDNNLIVSNLSVIFMYIDRFCRYCCRRSVYFCFPFSFFFFFNIVDIFVLSFRCRFNYPFCLLDIGFYAVCVRTRYIHLAWRMPRNDRLWHTHYLLAAERLNILSKVYTVCYRTWFPGNVSSYRELWKWET